MWCKTERTKDWVRLLPIISLMMNSQESSATGFTSHELFMGRPPWFLHAPYPEDSYSTVGKWVKQQQDKVDKAKAMLQRVRERQWNKKNKHRVPAFYSEGDWVLMHHSRRPAWPRSTSDDPYFGPYKMLWLRTAAAQRARKSQVAVAITLQSVNNEEGAVQRAPTQEILGRGVERSNKLVKRFSGRPGCGEFRTWKEDLIRAFTLSDITSPVDQVTTISFLLDGDAAEYYHSLTTAVQDDWFELMRVLGQRFDCISHEPVYLSRMLSLKESEFPRHADYVREVRTCVIKSKVNTSDLQIGYLVNSRFVEGLSNDAVRRQYIVEVRSRWRSNKPFGFDTLVETIAEAYIAAGYQLEEVQNALRTTSDHTLGPAVSRPLPMMVPPTSTSRLPSNPMPTLHVNPTPTPAAAPTALTVPEPMNLDAIAKLREEPHAYIGERRNERFGRQGGGRQDGRESRRCYNCGEQGHLARDCPKGRPPSRGRERRESRSNTPRRDQSRDSKGRFRSRSKSRERPTTA